MEQHQREDELSEAERRFVAHLARRVRAGDGMADIFGVDDEQLAGLEAQAFQLYRRRQFGRAKIAARGIVALDEERILTRLILGDIALEEFRLSEAIEHLRAAHDLEPDRLVVRSRLGEALLKQGEVEDARRHLEAVVDAGDEAPDHDLQRARVLLESIESRT